MTAGFQRVTIVGVGLIGGSLGLAMRRRGLAGRIVGVGHRQTSLDAARRRGAVDEATLDVARGVAGADLVVLATPVSLIVPLAEAARDALRAGAVLIDVGSTKARIAAALHPLAEAAGAWFVGTHPLAGSERRSIDAADPDLFADAVTIVTPTDETDPDAADRVEALWRAVGARTLRMPPAVHDRLLAHTSHLPHLVAAVLTLAVASAERGDVALDDLVAGGFRDTTRIARGAPDLWRDILLDNRDQVLAAMDALDGRLAALREALSRNDGSAVRHLLAQAKEARDALEERGVARS